LMAELVKSKNFNGVWWNFEKMSQLKMTQVKKYQFSQGLDCKINLKLPKIGNDNKSMLLASLEKVDWQRLPKDSFGDWARLFYELGVKLEDSGQSESAHRLWRYTVMFDPVGHNYPRLGYSPEIYEDLLSSCKGDDVEKIRKNILFGWGKYWRMIDKSQVTEAGAYLGEYVSGQTGRKFEYNLNGFDKTDLLSLFTTAKAFRSEEVAKYMYKMGLLFYSRNDDQQVEASWLTAIELAPDWSYFYKELASYYLLNDKIDEYKSVLSRCYQNANAAVACREFEQNYSNQTSNRPGFLAKEIDSI
jgi:hypothetical protein